MHYPYFDPFFLTLPLTKPKPAVVTVHDLIPLVFPDKFPPGIRGAVKWRIQKYSLEGAKRIITDSKCSKNDISDITGVNINKIDVVYLAPDPVFKPLNKKISRSGKPYVLYVGDVNWNKNVQGLLRAFSKLTGYNLVLAGNSFRDGTLPETVHINSLIHTLGIEQSVQRVGYVSDEALATLYSRAACLVQPSLYEGFGLPVLEAMACGCPVVCTNISSLKEIAGPAIVVSPSPDDLARGIMRAVQGDRETQVTRQYEWIRRFTWEKTAQETIVSYEKVLGTL